MQDLVPWPGIEPRSPALGGQRLSHWTTREVPLLIFKSGCQIDFDCFKKVNSTSDRGGSNVTENVQHLDKILRNICGVTFHGDLESQS